MNKPIISIIIIVKNDRGISNTLTGLEKQAKPVPTETIVIDASDPKELIDIQTKHSNVRWYQFIDKNKRKFTIPEQRNMGIKKAKGDIIVFIDANCIPSNNWLKYLTEPILNGEESITVGTVKASNPKSQVNIHQENFKGDYLTSSATINLAFRKSVLKEVGKFDENFFYGSDVDFTWRCTNAGYKIRFARNASVSHNWGSFEDQVRRMIKYGQARAMLYKKHPKRRFEIFNKDIFFLVYGVWIVGLPLTFFIHWYPATIFLICIKNIKNKPFKTVFLNLTHTIGLIIGIIELKIRVK